MPVHVFVSFMKVFELGLEGEYEQRLLPDGKLTIDGFLCVFDVSASTAQNKVGERQRDAVVQILQQLVKTKKPVVVVTTKNDDAHPDCAREVERMLSRKELRSAKVGGSGVVVVDSSAHDNVNVDHAFLVLAQLIDKNVKKVPKVTSYADACRAQQEARERASEAMKTSMRSVVSDYRCSWVAAQQQLLKFSEVQLYVRLFGTSELRNAFRRHVKQLRDEKLRRRLAVHLSTLQILLARVFPDLAATQDR